MKKLQITTFILLTVLLTSCLQSKKISNLTTTIESDHFILKHAENNDMSELINELEKTYTYFSNTYDIKLIKKTLVYVYPNIDDYHIGIGMPNSENWSVGTAENLGLYMVSPYNPGGVHDYNGIIKVASHEYIHFITMQLISYNIFLAPTWLNEGFAVYESGQYKMMEEQIKGMIYENSGIPSWDKLAKQNNFVQLGGYQYSPAIIHFLVENYGRNKLLTLIKKKGNVKEVYGKKVEQLELECNNFFLSL